MARKIIMSKTELIELMKTCKSRSEFTENHQAKYSLVYKKYPEILNKYFPLQGHFLAKMDNFTQREFITLKIKQCDTIIQFRDKFLKAYVYAKNYHSDLLLKFYGVKQVRGLKPRYTPDDLIAVMTAKGMTRSIISEKVSYFNDLIEFYPKLLEQYLPKIPTWRDLLQSMSKKELINKMKTYRTRTLFIRTGSLYYQYCLKSFPKLIDEIFPTETYLLDEMSLSKAKNEIIKVMKSCPNRSQFKWNHAGYYNFSQKNFPGLIDEILPKKEAYANSMGELTTKLFL